MSGNAFNISVRDAQPLPVETRYSVNSTATREFFMSSRLKNGNKITEPYRQHGITYAASRALASNIAQVPFLIHMGQDESSEDVLRDGPWVELFDNPNPMMQSRATFWETVILHLLDSGKSFWVKEGNTDQRIGPQDVPTELWPINGKFFSPLLDKETKLVAAWVYRPPNAEKPIIYEPHEIVIHRLTNPYDLMGGVGAYQPAELAILQDYKAARYNEAFFDADATPGGLLLAEGNISQQQRDQIRESWEERHQGINKRRRVALLTGGLKYEETGSTHREMEFEKGRAFAWKEDLAIIGTPEYEIGLTQNINMATAQMISKDWVTKRWIPLMRVLEDGMWSQMFKPVEGGERALMFEDARMTRRRRQAARMAYPHADVRLARDRSLRSYYDYRKMEPKRALRMDYSPMRIRPETSVWGEFDLTAIEALREDFNAKLEQAVKAQGLGVPFNQINDRLDLGFEKLEGEAGETSFIPSSLQPMELAINPPEPPAPVIAAPGAENKPAISAKPAEKKPAPKTDAEKKLALRPRLEAFVARRPADREKRWMEMIRKTKPLEEKFRAKYRRWLNDIRTEMLKKLGDMTPARASELNPSQIEHILFDPRAQKQKLLSLAHGVYVDASKVGIESAMTDLGGNFAFDVVDPKVIDAIEKRELILSKSTDTLRNRVKKDLERGVENGETIHQLQDRLRSDFNSFSGARSLMIARTEVAGATNTARNLAFSEEGVEETQWITARDEAVRDSHAEIDGDTAKIGQAFDNGLMFPGDPAGDASEVINCRCVAIPVVGRAAEAPLRRTDDRMDSREYRVPQINVVVPPSPAPIVHIAAAKAPIINVAPPVVNVAAPLVRIEAPAPTPAPIVNVEAPIINVAPPEESEKNVEYVFDADGKVVGYKIKKAKKE